MYVIDNSKAHSNTRVSYTGLIKSKRQTEAHSRITETHNTRRRLADGLIQLVCSFTFIQPLVQLEGHPPVVIS